MIIHKMNSNNVRGFTLIELMIATSVFSVVLLIAVAGFSQIGRLFYKGVSVTQSQDVASQIGYDLTSSIEGASKISTLTTYKGMQYICIGKSRYTIDTSRRVDISNSSAISSAQIGMLKDTMSSDGSCAPPCLPTPSSCASGEVAWTNPVELLGDSMKLENISVTPVAAVSGDYYTLSLLLSFGADDLVNYTTPGDTSTAECKSDQGGQFCAIGRFNASVNRGVGL